MGSVLLALPSGRAPGLSFSLFRSGGCRLRPVSKDGRGWRRGRSRACCSLFSFRQQASRRVVQILLRFGALFATPFSAHLCRILAHSVRTFCAFYAFSELSAKCSGCTGLRTEPLGLAWLSTEMVICCAFYVHLRTRMQIACRMHVNLHKMALAKLQVHRASR